MFTESDIETINFFDGTGLSRNDGQMSPIEELSQETNESTQMNNNFNSVSSYNN